MGRLLAEGQRAIPPVSVYSRPSPETTVRPFPQWPAISACRGLQAFVLIFEGGIIIEADTLSSCPHVERPKGGFSVPAPLW